MKELLFCLLACPHLAEQAGHLRTFERRTDHLDGNSFDHIAEALFKQKQLMDQLEAENRELRQRIADLRAGRGIFVDVLGSRFALADSPSPRSHLVGTR